jgi:hypothetical protein
MKKIHVIAILLTILSASTVYGAHPLITDDTGTQGKKKLQLEINGEYGHEDENGVIKNTAKTAATLSYGIHDRIDLILGIPYQHIRTKEADSATGEDGISDISIESKWRFFEKDSLSFALKPGITLPTGDRKRGLGTGRTAYSIFLITTEELKPWAFHLNLGLKRNENKNNERSDIWHTSLASELRVTDNLRVVANIGAEKNPDKASNMHPAFILGGIIYSISENFDVDFGVKGGINKTETDYTTLAGITWRF